MMIGLNDKTYRCDKYDDDLIDMSFEMHELVQMCMNILFNLSSYW